MKIDINSLTVGQAKELAAMFAPSAQPQQCELDEGLCICVMDRGFVYVGNLTIANGIVTIADAKNIRRWGTTAGLGQLVEHGAQADTKLDAYGTVRSLQAELKHWIKCKVSAWS